MRTAIDTNVLSALWSGEPDASDVARGLAAARAEGGLVVSAPVYAELLAHPSATAGFVDRFLADTGIVVDFDLTEPIWRLVAEAFASYAERRRRGKETHPKRLLVDFVVGAHAALSADCLMTLDSRRYSQDFPELRLV
ncbi:MAG TPA: type II toxin-antitoxin system VapC family toxin [Terriglobales bacterium]